jgi:phosphopantetheinyl transferase (holo-ACP synthase)
VFVGNDIVDILESATYPSHDRFASRVLHAEEYIIYRSHTDPATYLHRAWAAKESIYKLLKQRDYSSKFIPKNIRLLANNRLALVNAELFLIEFIVTDSFVYANARLDKNIKTINSVARIRTQSHRNQISPALASLSVRNLASREISCLIGIPAVHMDFNIGKDGAPLAVVHGSTLPLRLSFTHHGQYVGVAILCNPNREMFSTINMNKRAVDPGSFVTTQKSNDLCDIVWSSKA